MAEETPTEKNPKENVASKQDVAAAIEKNKAPKNPTVKLPANFTKVVQEIGITLKDIKLVNSSLEKTLKELDNTLATSKNTASEQNESSIKNFFKNFNLSGLKTATPTTTEEDTGAAVLKKEEPKPVIITNFDQEALKAQAEYYKREPLPIKLVEIEDKLLTKLEKMFEKLGKGGGKDSGGFFNAIIGAVKSMGPALKALGLGLGKGFESLGKGIGGGVAAIGKGFGSFLAGFGAGLGPLAAGLRMLANPQVAIGLGLVVLAVNGLALALRIAAPAIKEIIPLFEKIAVVIGGVFIKAIETVGEVFKAAIKEIPNMIRAVGDAIATVMERAGPTLLELARIIGDVVIKAIKEIGPIITALTPAFVALVKTIKEGVIETLNILKPVVITIIDGVKTLAGVIENILKAAIDAVAPVLMGLVPVVDKLVTLLGTALVEAIKGVSPVLQNLSAAIKSAIELIGKPIDAISNIVGKLLDLFKTTVTAVDSIVGKFLENADKIADVIGRTITGTIKGVKDLIVDTLGAVVNSIKQLSDIGVINMGKVAIGLAKIADSLKDFAGEAVKDGVRIFAALGRPGGPLDILSTLASRADKLDLLSKNVTALVDTFKTLEIPTDKIDELVAAFLKFNSINVDKIKELTQLPLDKLTKALAVATLVTTTATATPAATTTATETVATPSANVVAEEETEANLSPFAEVSALPKPTMQGEFGVNTTPILPVEPGTGSTPELATIAEKLERLIQTLQPLLEQRAAATAVVDNTSSSNVNASVMGGTTNTTIFANSVERDIPFMERNKYREQFLYSRGLI